MSKTKPGFGIPSADEYAKYSIDKIGSLFFFLQILFFILNSECH